MTQTFTKNLSSSLDYTFDWSDWSPIASYTITADAGITVLGDSKINNTVVVLLSGGTAGETYDITCEITTADIPALTESQTMHVMVIADPIVEESLDYVTGFPVVQTRTLLSIDRYAEIMGINPVFFNQGAQINLPDGSTLFPHGAGAPNVDVTWQQHSWDLRNNVSREELAYEISRAEYEISQYLGYWPAPTWTEEELIDLPSHYDPLVGKSIYDVRGNRSAVRIRKRKFIAGGRRAVAFAENACVQYVDTDGDGWAETARIVINTGTTTFNKHEYKVYFDGNHGEQVYEIRPPKRKYANGSVLTMEFDAWKFIKPEIKHAHITNDLNSINIDISNTDNLVTVVDVYREYNDTSQVSAQFVYSDGATQDGYLSLKNARADFVTVTPNDGCLTSCCGTPQFVKLWYYSGYKCPEADNAFDDYLDPTLARCIALLATARLSRPLAGNTKVNAHTLLLQTDMSVAGADKSYRMFGDIIYNNPFGTRYGEFLAYKSLIQFDKRL